MSATGVTQQSHKWVVDYEPVADSPVPAGSGSPTPRFTATGEWENEPDVGPDDGDVGENRNGLAVVITDGVKRIEVGRIPFRAELKGKSGFERKLRIIEETIAQPACDARNAAEARLAQARYEAHEVTRRARQLHDARVRDAQDALRQVENESIKVWDGEVSNIEHKD